MTSNQLTFREVLGKVVDGKVLNKTVSIFDLIEVCEKSITKGMEKYPDKAELIWNMFMPLGEFANDFSPYTPDLFGSHCDEIIERIGKGYTGEMLHLGTDAEVLLSLMYASLKAPLNQDGSAMFATMFFRLFGSLPMVKGISESERKAMCRGSYDNAVEVLVSDTKQAIGRRRIIEIPKRVELDIRRKKAMRQGTLLPWMAYQTGAAPVQTTLFSLSEFI